MLSLELRVLAILLCLALVGFAMYPLYSWVGTTNAPSQASAKQSDIPKTKSTERIKEYQPEVMLLSPAKKHKYRWIPKEEVAIFQGLEPPKEVSFPIFGFRNLSNGTIIDITIEWKIVEPFSVEQIFLSNEYFGMHNPKIEESTHMFWLSGTPLDKTKSTGFGMPVADSDVTHIPFCEPTTSRVDALQIPLPNTIANNYALRIVAVSQRPSRNNIPNGIVKTSGPVIRATIKYRHSGKEYARYFRIESLVNVLSDTTGDGNVYIEPHYWSPENFRAIVSFNVVPDRLQ